ncbi:hypothetical protein BJ085DRAFT_40732 [Dimargaris cristalligena]|uniref:Galactose oxidase n=1 Tax=Dimargaris cristalligena TaxID=215637 RepID=A0A4P9ZYR7_9FUNG|nr:hypothetical protein BJ085DRAFT_40732 [Dimargaris cristalligena]|eukprot:RKP38894.1 hypothetical protein BJ085DRAFT_40732 [Dimargaris cristalligena]
MTMFPRLPTVFCVPPTHSGSSSMYILMRRPTGASARGLRRLSTIVLLAVYGCVFFARASDLEGRYGHQTIFHNDTLYVLGGTLGLSSSLTSRASEELTLDLRQPFKVSEASWNGQTFATGGATTLDNFSATLVQTSTGSRDILLCGGTDPSTNRLNSQLWQYDFTTPQWQGSNVAISNQRTHHSTVYSPSESALLIYGGFAEWPVDPTRTDPSNQLTRYSYESDNWEVMKTSGSQPPKLYKHSAVMLNNTHMALLGGLTTNGDSAPTTYLYLYNVTGSAWSIVNVTGTLPDTSSTSAVMWGSTIILYGGLSKSKNSPTDEVTLVNTRASPWSSTTQNVNGVPGPRYGHTATLVGSYMFIAFGNTGSGPDNTLAVMDVAKFQMVDNFDLRNAQATSDGGGDPVDGSDPSSTGGQTSQSGRSKDGGLSTGVIVGLVVGVVVALAVVIAVLWFCVRKRKKTQYSSFKSNTPPPGLGASSPESSGSGPLYKEHQVSTERSLPNPAIPSFPVPIESTSREVVVPPEPTVPSPFATAPARILPRAASEGNDTKPREPFFSIDRGVARGKSLDARDASWPTMSATAPSGHRISGLSLPRTLPEGFSLPEGPSFQPVTKSDSYGPDDGSTCPLDGVEVQTVAFRKVRLYTMSSNNPRPERVIHEGAPPASVS